jgi:hypothetical protein
LITQPTQIEFGNLSRGANNPILIKEKTDENGDTILRIYQRKDLQSISSPFEKIKNVLRYSLEDFGREHKTAAKLLEKIGFGKIRELKTDGTEKAVGLIENMRSGARTGLIDEKSKTEFDHLLSDNNINDYSGFKFYEGTYSDQNFAQDLIYITEKINTESSLKLSNESDLLKILIDKEILKNPLENLGRLDSLLKEIGEISNKVEDFFDKNNTNNQLREEFFKKLREVFCEPMLVAIGAENTKNWLLQHENKLIETISNTDDQSLIKDQEITINNIHSAFSNHWWDSDEKKAKSMVDLYYGYVNSEDVPNIIKQYIYFSVEELLKKNPSLFSKVKELQEAHEK